MTSRQLTIEESNERLNGGRMGGCWRNSKWRRYIWRWRGIRRKSPTLNTQWTKQRRNTLLGITEWTFDCTESRQARHSVYDEHSSTRGVQAGLVGGGGQDACILRRRWLKVGCSDGFVLAWARLLFYVSWLNNEYDHNRNEELFGYEFNCY